MCVDILFAFLVQLCAAELLCESGDADDVSRFQMFVEEITAGLGYVLHLISYRRRKKHRKLEYLTLKGLLTGGNWRQSVFVCFHLLPMRIIFPSQPATVYVCLPHSTQENVKHTFLSHRDVGGVGEVDEHSHHLRGNVR